MSIRTKAVSMIIALVLTVAIFAFTLIYSQNKRVITENVEFKTGQLVDYNQEIIDNYVSSIKARLITLAKDEEVVEYLKTRDEELFNKVSAKIDFISENDVFFEGLSINSNECVFLVGRKVDRNLIGMDFSDRDYCKGMEEAKEPYVSSAFISTSTGHSVLAVAVPVKNDRGEMIGYVNGIVNFNGIRDSFLKLQIKEKDQDIFLLDRYGQVFLYTKTERYLTEITPDYEREAEVGIVNQKVLEGEIQGFFEHLDKEGGKEFIVYKKFEYLTIIIAQPTATAFILANKINEIVVLTFILIVILLTIAVFFVSGFILRPIKSLAKVSREITGGNLTKRTKIKSKDEIGQLAESFNQMTDKLVKSKTDVEKKVEKRTAELKKAVDNLERTNKLMVGRELEMVKLKKELEELENKKEFKKL